MSKDNFSRILPKNQVEISDIKYCLQSQLQTFSVTMFEKKEDLIFQDIIDYFKQLGPGAKTLLSEVGVIVKLVQLLPATTASPERSFSKIKLTKNYLRSTRTQPCLNHFMILIKYISRICGQT